MTWLTISRSGWAGSRRSVRSSPPRTASAEPASLSRRAVSTTCPSVREARSEYLPGVRYRMTKVKFVPNRKTITRLNPKRNAGRT